MAFRARLAPPRLERADWAWHDVKSLSLPIAALLGGDRRMEAEAYLLSGYGLRAAIKARPGWSPLGDSARVWQPSRLKGIQVSPDFGTPFLAATQVFDVRPVPRKWLALARTHDSAERYIKDGMILVTCSGSVGRATLTYAPHRDTLISHDLLRVEARDAKHWGWLYAYLRAPTARAMMTSAQYGHIIKHLEVGHLGALPLPNLPDAALDAFNARVRAVLDLREKAHAATLEAEDRFAACLSPLPDFDSGEKGFSVSGSEVFSKRRRLEAACHAPVATALLAHFRKLGLRVEPLGAVTDRVWWMTRFSRVFGEDGVPYMSAEELFAQNPTIQKFIMREQAKDADAYFPKAGWIIMACSGQVYGLLGSVGLMTPHHEKLFLSHDLIRIVPRRDLIRAGYLHTALGHPRLGRPLVVRHAYGTSIPHLEPTDIETCPIVRLAPEDEDFIADRAEESAAWRAEADILENEIADEAERILTRFVSPVEVLHLPAPKSG